jgi:hypothetical protein
MGDVKFIAQKEAAGLKNMANEIIGCLDGITGSISWLCSF